MKERAMYIKSKIASVACAIGMAGALAFTPSATAQTALFFDGVNTPFSTPNQAQDYIAPSWYENGGTSQVVDWPRQMSLGPVPFLGWMTLNKSTDQGVANAMPIVDELHDNGESVSLVGLSGGAIVVLKVKIAAIDKYGPNAVTESVTYGDPTNGDGGILTKLPSGVLKLLGLPDLNSDDYPRAQYETTVANRYDIIADAPDVSVFQNPVAWANAVMGYAYYHDEYSFSDLDEALQNGDVVTTTTFYNEAGEVIDPDTDPDSVYGYKSHILVNKGVPLLRPVRDFFLLINNDAGDVRVNAFFDEIDNKVIKPIVEAGYDHGDDPEVDTREVSTVTKPEPPVAPTSGEEENSSESSDNDNSPVNRVNVNSAQTNAQEPADPGPVSDASSASEESDQSEPATPDKPSWKERREAKKAALKEKIEAAKEAAKERRESRSQAAQELKEAVEEKIDDVRENLSPSQNDDNDDKKTTNDAGNDDKGGDGSES